MIFEQSQSSKAHDYKNKYRYVRSSTKNGMTYKLTVATQGSTAITVTENTNYYLWLYAGNYTAMSK